MSRGLPRSSDGARDYFQHYEQEGFLAGYVAGADFGSSYVVSLYRGFSWNFEDLVPERPEELLLEVLISAGLVCIRSYCIGSFFKYHQKKENEMQQFNDLMDSVRSYMELCELPPSLRKDTILHFRFQQAKRREARTMEVLAMLPLEAQKKVKQHEYLPIVAQRNMHIFGGGISYEFSMQVVMILEPRFMQPGEVIFLEGDMPRELVFLDTGSVALSRMMRISGSSGKTSDHLMHYLRGDRKEDPTVLGEAAFLLEHQHLYSARVRAGLDAVVLCLPKARFDEELVGVYPEQYEHLVRNLAESMMLDIHGNSYQAPGREKSAEHDTEHFLAIQGVVRRLLQMRQEQLNASFVFASSCGDIKLVRELLGRRVDVNTSDYDKRSALHVAASEGMQEALEVLLTASGDANLKDRWGSTPLQDALNHGSQGAAKLLQRYHAELGLEDPSGVLCTCATEGDVMKMQQLLDFGVDLNQGDYDKRTALHLAATEGRLTEVAFLVSRSANINVVDRWNSTPLMDAIRNGFPTVAHHLRAHGGVIDGEFAGNLLCEAASIGNLEQIRMLIDNGVDVNEGDYDQRTAVHLAASEGQLLALSYLVNVANANPSPKDRWEGTPLQDALGSDHELCVHFLLAEGGNLGPSASEAMKQDLTRLKNEWFKEAGKGFYEKARALRQKIATHTVLVKEGRARSDIFELEEAKTFNGSLVNQQVNGMGALGSHLGSLVVLLQRLEQAGLKPMAQLRRLLDDAECLDTEATFWQRIRIERSKTLKRGKAKDATSHVLDQVLFGTTSITPGLKKVIRKTAGRLLARVDALNEQRLLAPDATRPVGLGETFLKQRGDVADLRSELRSRQKQKSGFGDVRNEPQEVMPRLSGMVFEELFKALGWEASDDPGQRRSAGNLGALGNGGSARSRRLAGRLEELAGRFLPVEHMTNSFVRGVLDPRVCGEGVSTKPSALPRHEFHRWLDMHATHTPWAGQERGGSAMEVLGDLGRHLEEATSKTIEQKQGLPLGLPAGLNTAQLRTLAYAPLWRPGLKHGGASVGAPGRSPRGEWSSAASSASWGSDRHGSEQIPSITKTGAGAISRQESTASELPTTSGRKGRQRAEDYSDDEARRKLVAGELVLVAVCAIILDIWEHNPRLQHRNEDSAKKRVAKANARSKKLGFQQAMSPLKAARLDGRSVDSASNSSGSLASSDNGRPSVSLTNESFEHLAREIAKAADACRGAAAQKESQRQEIQAALRKVMRDEKKLEKKQEKDKRNMRKVQNSRLSPSKVFQATKQKESTKEEEHAHETSQPIQMAKILGLHGTIEPSDLAMLLDFSDVPQTDETGAILFGEVSRERFVLNMLRWILGQDEWLCQIMERAVQTGDSAPGAMAVDGSAAGSGPLDERGDAFGAMTRETLSDGQVVEIKWDHLKYYEDLDRDANASPAGSEDEEDEEAEAVVQTAISETSDLPGDLALTDNPTLGRRTKTLGRTQSFVVVGREMDPCWACRVLCQCWVQFRGSFGQAGRIRRRHAWLASRFRELDEGGEGIGVVDLAKMLGAVYHHTLGQEQELRGAQRMFELLELDEIGDLVTLPELLKVMPVLEEELREQQRKRRHTSVDSESSWRITRVMSWMVVPPDSWWLPFWDQAKFTVCAYYMMEVPIRFCFISIDSIPEWQALLLTTLNTAADIMMIANVGLNFFRSFVHPSRGFVTNFREIRVHYLLNYFFLDALACFPADYMLRGTAGFSVRGPLSRLVPAARLLRLLHMRNLFLADKFNFVSESEDQRRKMTESFFRTAVFLLKFVLIVVHFVACIWWYLGSRFDSFNPRARLESSLGTAERWSWIYGYVERPGEPSLGDETGQTPFWWQYLIAFYWSAGRITGLGTVGQMFPGSLFELGWSCVLFLMGFAISGFVDGILAGKVITRDEDTIEARATQRIVEDFLQTVELPEQLAMQIRATAGATAEAHLGNRVEEVSRRLPHPLKLKIARRSFLPYFGYTDVFGDCTDGFLSELAVACRVLQAGRDSLLAYAGEPATRLLILCHGRIGFMDTQGNVLAKSSNRGEMVGHMPLLFEIKHMMGATTLEESKLLSISKADFVAVCKLYPADRIAMRRNLIDILEGRLEDNMTNDQSSVPGLDRAMSSALGSHMAGSFRGKNSVGDGSVGSSKNSGNSSKGSGISRMYTLDLALVREKASKEQLQARQQSVCTLIDYAASGNLELLEEMLSKGDMVVDEGDYDQRTALHLAVCGGHLPVVSVLVETYNASLSVKDRFGHTPMDDAVREHMMEVARYLHEKGARYQVDADVAGSLCQAGHDADLDRLKLLLEVVGVDPNTADYDRRTALHLAACQGHAEVVRFMISLPGTNLNCKDRFGNTPLDDAMRHRHAECRHLLQTKGAEMGDEDAGVQLCSLGFANDWEKLRELHESGVPMQQGDYDARTALHLAASEGKLEAATFLLNEAKVDPNPLDRFLSTPLDDAVRHGRRAIESLIREHGGLSGKAPQMKEQVEEFQRFMQGERERKALSKLEREIKNTEVHGLTEGLNRLANHPTFEEDVHTFVASAVAFRGFLMKLVREQALEEPQSDARDEGDPVQFQESGRKRTRDILERLLDQAAVSADVAASKLILALETEVLPWTAALSKNEAKMLRTCLRACCCCCYRYRYANCYCYCCGHSSAAAVANATSAVAASATETATATATAKTAATATATATATVIATAGATATCDATATATAVASATASAAVYRCSCGRYLCGEWRCLWRGRWLWW